MHSGVFPSRTAAESAAGREKAMHDNKKTKRKRLLGILAAVLILITDIIFVSCGSKENVTLDDAGTMTLPAAEESEDAVTTASTMAETGSTKAEEASTEALTEDAAKICIYVCGAVQKEGIVYLEEGARVYEAIEAAGGFSEDADPRAVNQAMVLQDGQELLIPTLEETESGSTGSYGIVTGQSADQAEEESTLVNINTADRETLMTLPGIGEAKADAILSYRETNGTFSSIEEIKNVPGIKDAGFAKIQDRITCGP